MRIRTLLACAAAALCVSPGIARAAADSPRLLAQLDAAFVRFLEFNPSLATELGMAVASDRWEDLTEAGMVAEADSARRELAALQAGFAGAQLGPREQLQRRVFEAQLEREIERFRWRNHLYPLNQIVGPHIDVPRVLESQAVTNPAEAAAYLRRIRAAGPYITGLVRRLEAQAAAGVWLPKPVYPLLISARRENSLASNPKYAIANAKAMNTHEAAHPKKRICPANRLVWPDMKSINAIIGPADCTTAASKHANGTATKNIATRCGRCSATNARICESELPAKVVTTASAHSGHTSKRSQPCKSYLQPSQRTCEESLGTEFKVILISECAVPRKIFQKIAKLLCCFPADSIAL